MSFSGSSIPGNSTVNDAMVVGGKNLWKDYLNGVLLVAGSGWATAPTTLANITDASDTSVTGFGDTTQTATPTLVSTDSEVRATYTGQEIWTAYVRLKVGLKITGGATLSLYLEYDASGGTTSILTTTSSTEVITTATYTLNQNSFSTAGWRQVSSSPAIALAVITSSGLQTASARFYTFEAWGLSRSNHG